MKTEKYFLIFFVTGLVLYSTALGKVEIHPPDGPVLLDQPNLVLADIGKIHVAIIQPDSKPNKDGLVWKNLKTDIKKKLKETSLKMIPGKAGKLLDVPALRVHIAMLKFDDMQKYVFHVQSVLAKKMSIGQKASRFIKVDVWKSNPVMQAVSVQDMPATVTKVVLDQAETFAHAYLAAKSKNDPISDADVANPVKKHARPADKQTAAEYKYVSSRKSKIFHTPNCSVVKRISPQNLIGYNDKEDMVKGGKRSCRRCKP